MKRHKTEYKGVYYRIGDRLSKKGKEKIFYIVFKKNGKVYEEKVGRQYADEMTAAQANRKRSARNARKATITAGITRPARTSTKRPRATAPMNTAKRIVIIMPHLRKDLRFR